MRMRTKRMLADLVALLLLLLVVCGVFTLLAAEEKTRPAYGCHVWVGAPKDK